MSEGIFFEHLVQAISCFGMKTGLADATMKNSSAVPRQNRHKQRSISAFFTSICFFASICFLFRQKPAHPPEREREKHLTNLLELPKKCIRVILSFTTPRDVCRLEAVSRVFRSAVNSDSVWNKFIPPQCYQILPTAVTLGLFSSKREFYFRLCDSVLIDEGKKRFWLERSTGKIGYMLSARELSISSGDDKRFWRWISRNDSRFDELVKLLDVCWLDVAGGIDCRLLSPDTEYRVVFVLKFGDQPYGWNRKPVKFSVKTPGKEEMEFEYLFPVKEWRLNTGRRIEVIAGEFTVRATENIGDDSHIRFRMKEVESNQRKGGLLIDGVRIEPSSAPLQGTFGMRCALSPSLEEKVPELQKKCIEAILSFTTPRDVCRLAAVSNLFRSAANSDYVWSNFIPPESYQILSTPVTVGLFSSKRELYFRLCDSILIEEGRKRFWLERSTGKIGYMLSARELSIVSGDDQRFWRWISRNDSRFDELAELLRVSRLNVAGGMDCRRLSPDTMYTVVFILQFRERSDGWSTQPIKFSVKTPGKEELEIEYTFPVVERLRNTGRWIEVVAGEFRVRPAEDIGDDSSHIGFRMKEVESNQWKVGLLIDGVRIEPSSAPLQKQPWSIPVYYPISMTDDSSEESTTGYQHEREQQAHLRNLSDLPLKCIKVILSFTTPRDVCRLAAVSTRFRSAANSNSLWTKFIPPQCYHILPTAVTLGRISSKREIYFRLCDSVLIEEGRKIFWLERSTAKIGYMLSARELALINEEYWRWVSRDDSRFDKLAELAAVCWLEVLGRMDCRLLSSDTGYRVVFMLKFAEHSYGWTGQSMNFRVTTPEGEEITSEQLLVAKEGVANNGWTEIVAAEFTVRAAKDIQDESSSMSFRMTDLTSWWKGGLLIDGVKIEPCKST